MCDKQQEKGGFERNMKRTAINLMASIAAMITNIIIGFWISPYVIVHIGIEANGFITLANNFITYASLVVTALNSMASRFIAIEYIKKDYKRANLYYNSVFWGNFIIVAVVLPISVLLIWYLELVINIPHNILIDVKVLFSFVFLNFFLQTGAPNWECSTFVTNRLDRVYIPNMLATLFRGFFLFAIMTFFKPKVWYVGLVSSIILIITLIIGWYNTKILTPELYIVRDRILCSWKTVKDLVGAGIWNSISSIGSMLLSGLDLLICNVFIGSTEMGILALAKLLPSYMQNFSMAIFNAFNPELVINYASGDKEKLVHDLKRAMKIMSSLLSVPLCGLIVMSGDFFKLWVPSQNPHILACLTIVMCMGYSVTSGTQILNCVFSTVNKVRTNSLIIILCGAISTGLVFVLINTTNLGIYAIAGVSVMVDLLRMQVYTLPVGTRYLEIDVKPFYRHEIFCLVDLGFLCIVAILIRRCFVVNNWKEFIFVAGIVGSVCMVVNIFFYLGKEERKSLLETIRRKIGRK